MYSFHLLLAASKCEVILVPASKLAKQPEQS